VVQYSSASSKPVSTIVEHDFNISTEVYSVPHGPQQSVPEGMFDDSIDFVMWGHEHDCRIQPEEVAGKRYRICQPGSSVATSLAEGESLEK
jgi:hypothetical protein